MVAMGTHNKKMHDSECYLEGRPSMAVLLAAELLHAKPHENHVTSTIPVKQRTNIAVRLKNVHVCKVEVNSTVEPNVTNKDKGPKSLRV